MLHRVALVRTEVSEELSSSIIRMTRIGELETLAVTSSPILVTLMMGALRSTETSVLTRATWCNIPEDAIIQVDYLSNLLNAMTQTRMGKEDQLHHCLISTR
jgi:hypothetical protein